MGTLLVTVLLWVVLAAPIVNADAAIVNNTDPGCDAGEPSCAISASINEALANESRTHDLTVNGQRARGCANFGGRWEASMFGGVRCSVAPSVNQPFSSVLPSDVAQQGCRFSYSDFGGQQRGTIGGRTIRIPRPKIPDGFLNLFRLDSVKANGRGRIQDQNRAQVRISAQVKGEINGIRTSCTIKWTTNFVRQEPPPPAPPPPSPPPPLPPPQACPPPALGDTCIDFNTLPDGTPTSDPAFSLVAVDGLYSALGVTFRSKDGDAGPTFSHPLHPDSSRSIVIGDSSRPPGGTFNIVADFSPPVTFVSADVLSAVGRSVSMTAKDASGAILGSTISSPETISAFPFKGNVALSGIDAISTVEFEAAPDPVVAGVSIDNLTFSVSR